MTAREASPPLHRRLAAWLVTGPIGFLAAGIVDWAALVAHYLWSRARGRDPWP
ncbi:MAG TPA: hypothetical protein VKA96_02390 [Solirubrobacteraceae bacterium]|nr:hypothetical protein [Solirubrobacteraceae bacterium]